MPSVRMPIAGEVRAIERWPIWISRFGWIRRDYVAALDSRRVVHLHLGQYQLAIEDYDAALRLAPRFALSLSGRGVARIKSGDATGNADIAEAIRINPNVEARMTSYGVTP
jgi:tetratricopeptide (TPR) repeat protein